MNASRASLSVIPALLAATLLAGTTTVRAAEGAESNAPTPAGIRASSPWREPLPDVLTGGQPAQDDWRALAGQGVTTVVNLRPREELPHRDEAAEVEAAGLRYHAIPVANAGDLTGAKARELWSLLQQADGKVLVHCASGNRVGALLALAAAQAGGHAPEQALELGKRAGLGSAEPKVREHLGLDTGASD